VELHQVKKQIQTLKIHVDMLEEWAKQATNMIYQLEEDLAEQEEKEWFEKYIKNNQMIGA
jgi:proteasome assembly chaperone (PAC2) family protein